MVEVVDPMKSALLIAAYASALLAFFAWSWADIEMGLGWKPWHYPSRIRALRAARFLRRISAMEHELGYTPCSDPECWACRMTDDERKWLYGGSHAFEADYRLTKEMPR